MTKKLKIKAYRQLIFCLSLIFCLCLATSGRANPPQESFIIKGTVTESNGQPVPGATIMLEGSTLGTATDKDGNFTIRLLQKEGYLVVSCIGFQKQKVHFLAGQPLKVKMQESVLALDEVQIITYGSQKRGDNMSAMTVVKPDNALELPSGTIQNLLQGKAAGVNVSAKGGPMGRGTAIAIRGTSNFSNNPGDDQPLYVIDGIVINATTSDLTGTNPLAELNPSDIESISLLKDAYASAMYGSRAANGVVLITTHKGKYNQDANGSATVSYGLAFGQKLPLISGNTRKVRQEALENYQEAFYDEELGIYRYPTDYLDALKHNAQFNYYLNRGEGAVVPILQDSLNSFYRNSTNLYDYYYRVARTLDANLKVAGGTERINYSLGLGYYDAKGVLIKTGMKRLSFLSNLGIKPVKNLEINTNLYLAYTDYDRGDKGQDLYNLEENNNLEQVPAAIYEYSPLLPGPGHPAFEKYMERYNSIKEKNNSYNLRANVSLIYDLPWDLTLKMTGGLNYNQQNLNVFKPSALSQYNESHSYGGIRRNMTLLNEDILGYKRSFGEHNLDMMVGVSFESNENNTINGFGDGTPNDLIRYVIWDRNVYNQETGEDKKGFNTYMDKQTLMAVLFRANYNYKHKYYASFSIRRDASSVFGENVRWGTFPSFALAYTFTEEPFMDPVRAILNYGKIRLTYGVVGRQLSNLTTARGELQVSPSFLGRPGIEPEWFNGLSNSKLSWEETRQWNIGADLEFFDSRIKLTADYYYRYTDKLLFNIALPGNHSGYQNQWRNAYAISNQGIEIQVEGDVIRKENFRWNLGFNIAKNWNRLEKSDNGIDFQNRDARFTNNISIIGKPLNGIYVYDDRGVYQDQSEVPYYWKNGQKVPLTGGTTNQFYRPGDRIYIDSDGNGRIDAYTSLAEDRVYAGSPLPVAHGGITTTFNWKGFNLDILFNYVIGQHILNTEKSSWGTYISSDPNEMAAPVYGNVDPGKYWKYPGDNSLYPANRAGTGLMNFATNIRSNVEYVHYLNLGSIALSYSLPAAFTQKWGFGAKIFFSGQNLFVLTNYKGADPRRVPSDTGVDSPRYYPVARTVTGGISFTF